MVFRWFGDGNDRVSLRHIRQIPGVEGMVWALHDLAAGEIWPMARILEVKQQADFHGLHMQVVESVNVHEDIKLGLATRDEYIEHYAQTIANLAKVGVKVICYNFMPVFDWARTDLYKVLEDGSSAMFYERKKIDDMDPSALVEQIACDAQFSMPGWEPERLQRLSSLFAAYQHVTAEDLWENLAYFLKKIIPVAQAHDIKMAIHPDDPPWPIFGLPRIITNRSQIQRLLGLFDSPYHGVTLCSGSLGANPGNDVAQMVRDFGDRIPFAHIRNVKVYDNGDFVETSHRSADGSVDVCAVVKAYHDIGFTGYVRPDHGRDVFDEKGRPGYGLYDRAMGVMYLWGIWDSLEKQKQAFARRLGH